MPPTVPPPVQPPVPPPLPPGPGRAGGHRAEGLPRPKLDRGIGRTILILAVTLAAMAAVGIVILAAALSTGSTGGSVLTLVLAAIPVPFLVGAYLWLDRYEPEPLRFLVTALVWGALLAVLIAGGVEYAAEVWFDAAERTLVVGVAPLIEEFAKGLIVVFVLLARRRVVTGIVDGLIYAGLSAVGFAFTENVLYYSGAYSGSLDPSIEGAGGATGLFIVRGVFSPFAHPLFTSAIGIGMAVAVTTRRRWLRWSAPLLGYAGAVCLHAAWNGSAFLYGPKEFLLTYVAAMLPLLGAGIGLAAWARVREGRVLSRALSDAAGRGWLHPAEIHWLVRFGDRAAARRFARRVAGPHAATALRAYQQAATEMAFMHDRVLRGTAPADGVQRVHAHLERMQSWRPFVVMPPVSWSAPVGGPAPGPQPGAPSAPPGPG